MRQFCNFSIVDWRMWPTIEMEKKKISGGAPSPGLQLWGSGRQKRVEPGKGGPVPFCPGPKGALKNGLAEFTPGAARGARGHIHPTSHEPVAFGKPRPRSPGRLVVKGAARSAPHGAAGGRRRVHREQPRRPEPPAASGPERVRHARALSPHGGRPGGGRGSGTPLRGTSLRPQEAAVRQVTLLATEPGPVESHTIL